jgi:hypothetical protein
MWCIIMINDYEKYEKGKAYAIDPTVARKLIENGNARLFNEDDNKLYFGEGDDKYEICKID